MSNSGDERLSSLLDGELSEMERHQALDALERDADLHQRWQRYQLMSDAIRRNLPDHVDNQFSARVMAALESEPTILAPPATKSRAVSAGLNRRFAGLAVAASVAVVAVLGVQGLYQEDPTAATGTQQVAKSEVPGNRFVQADKSPVLNPKVNVSSQVAQVAAERRVTPRKDFDPRLNKYLVNHNQQAAHAGFQGMMPYARIVTYPIDRQAQYQR